MKKLKVIALVAHDSRKKDMIEWVSWNWKELLPHKLVCTGTTGKLISEALYKKAEENDMVCPEIICLKSGPLGGDQQLGALICDEKVDILIFFWDPMEAQPHDVDIKALLRISTLYNIPAAYTRSSADFIVSSQLFHKEYKPIKIDYLEHINRNVLM
ncbi:MAG: methylglyoxal synthase [Marinilabiliaceae bacterium]|nr:methylglyoxal synthase [Marinilabiliaceae bacterium]